MKSYSNLIWFTFELVLKNKIEKENSPFLYLGPKACFSCSPRSPAASLPWPALSSPSLSYVGGLFSFLLRGPVSSNSPPCLWPQPAPTSSSLWPSAQAQLFLPRAPLPLGPTAMHRPRPKPRERPLSLSLSSLTARSPALSQ